MKKPKIFLIVPPTGLYIREDRCQTPIEDLKTVALRPPIDLLYAAAGFIQGGAECIVKDYPAISKGWDDFKNDIESILPDYVVLSITTPSIEEDLKAAEIVSKVSKTIGKKIYTIAKGAHFNILHEETLKKFPSLDIVLRGEYEITCKEIAEGKPLSEIFGISFRDNNNNIITTPPRDFINNLDEIPFPPRYLIDNSLYVRPDTMEPQTTIVTNRGCPFNCIFCLANQVAGRKNRRRSPENIIAEIKECIEKYNIKNFLFRSDLFTATKQWTIELCEKIIKEQLNIKWGCNSRVDTIDEELLQVMKKAGCWIIAYGIESGDQNSLDKMNKKTDLLKAENAIRLTHKAGINSSIYLLFGFPWDTNESLQKSVDFACKLNPDFLEIFYVYPFPGTDLYKKVVNENLLKNGEIPKSAYSSPAMPSHSLSIDELTQWRRKALRQFLLRPSYIVRTLAKCRSPKVLKNYIKYGWIQFIDLIKKR